MSLIKALVFSTLIAFAYACACSAPGAGVCTKCSSYGGVEYISFANSNGKNKVSSGYLSCYYGSCASGGSGLNFELFTEIANTSNPKVIVTPSSANSLSSCCSACSSNPFCTYFHYIPSISGVADMGTNPLFSSSSKCYLVNAPLTPTGNAQGDYIGLPFSNVASIQAQTKDPKIGTYQFLYYLPTFVGCQCNPYVYADPHLRGGHGTKFDFNGRIQKPYCMLTTPEFAINSLLDGYKTEKTEHSPTGVFTWMKELGFSWKSAGQTHTLRAVARKSPEVARGNGYLAAVEVDSTPISLPAVGDKVALAGDAVFSFESLGKYGTFDVENYKMVVGDIAVIDISMRVAQTVLQTQDDAEAHFSFQISYMKPTEDIHGVLGQTYRQTPEQALKAVKFSQLDALLHRNFHADASEGLGFLDGKPEDYVTSSVVSPDCKFSTF